MEDRTYLGAFGTILPPAGGSRDVRFLGCGVDALVAEVDHAVACLIGFSRALSLSSFRTAGGIYVLDG